MPMPQVIATLLLSPDLDTAIRIVVSATPKLAGVKTARAKTWVRSVPYQCIENAKRLYDDSKPVVALMWMFLSLRPGDGNISSIVADAEGYRGAPELPAAALRVWREIADGTRPAYGTDLFSIVHKARSSKTKSATVFKSPKARETPPALELMRFTRWDTAASWLYRQTWSKLIDNARLESLLPMAAFSPGADRKETRDAILGFVDHLWSRGGSGPGEFALAWLMMCCDPRMPTTFNYVVPQLQYLLARETTLSADEARELHQTLDTWFRCCAGEFVHSEYSAFTIASDERRNFPDPDVEQTVLGFESVRQPRESRPIARDTAPGVKIIVGSREASASLPIAWKEMVDKRLPLVVAKDLVGIRRRLHAEYPHATHVVDSLLRDLRDDAPVRLQPVVLVGPPGAGKSRFARSFAAEISQAAGRELYVARYDAAASHDAMFAGSPKTWSNSQSSVPARAVLRSQIANPIVMVDEIEKAGSGTYNGRLWDAMHPFLERETSARYPETGLGDVELDLSWVSYIATANSLDGVPATLIDRFRVLKVPAPTLAHLPALAAVVMRDLAKNDDARANDEPLAPDELDVIGRAWRAEKFSMRKLQRLVGATLETRDACARRH